MDKYRKNFYKAIDKTNNLTIINSGLDMLNIIKEMAKFIISLNIGFTSYIEEQTFGDFTEHYRYHYYTVTLKNEVIGKDIKLQGSVVPKYDDTNTTVIGYYYDYFTLSLIGFGCNYNFLSLRLTYQDMLFLSLTMYKLDNKHIILGFEDIMNDITLHGWSNAFFMLCTKNTEQEQLLMIGNAPRRNGDDSYEIGKLYDGILTTRNKYCMNSILDVSTKVETSAIIVKIPAILYSTRTTDYTTENLLDKVYQSNKANLHPGEVYTINNKDYLCINGSYGMLVEC